MTPLDAIDAQILDQLRKNATIARTELARRVGLSNTACRARISKLEKSGVISGYSIVENKIKNPDTEIISYVFWPLNAKGGNDFQEFKNFLLQIPEVSNIMLVTGEYDYLIRISCNSSKAYQLVHQKIQSHPLSGKPFTATVIEVIK